MKNLFLRVEHFELSVDKKTGVINCMLLGDPSEFESIYTKDMTLTALKKKIKEDYKESSYLKDDGSPVKRKNVKVDYMYRDKSDHRQVIGFIVTCKEQYTDSNDWFTKEIWIEVLKKPSVKVLKTYPMVLKKEWGVV